MPEPLRRVDLRPAADPLGPRLAAARAEAALFGGDPPPVCVGRFELEREIGRGGLGVVYAARDPELGRRVALKVVAGGAEDVDRRRLLREAQAMARLTHPNVVTVYEAGAHEHGVWIAMELVDGVDLRGWQGQGGRTRREVLDVFMAAGRGLAAAHAAGVVHRDFKPENVLVASDGRVLVVDFGLAGATEHGGETGRPASSAAVGGLTIAHAGTPLYMAPEQHAGERSGPAADQFAFCVALWEGLCGAPPWSSDRVQELDAAKREGPTSRARRGVPRYLLEVLRRGLEPDPGARWPSLLALLEALGRDPRAGRRRLLLVVVATVFIGIVLAGTAFQIVLFLEYMAQARR